MNNTVFSHQKTRNINTITYLQPDSNTLLVPSSFVGWWGHTILPFQAMSHITIIQQHTHLTFFHRLKTLTVFHLIILSFLFVFLRFSSQFYTVFQLLFDQIIIVHEIRSSCHITTTFLSSFLKCCPNLIFIDLFHSVFRCLTSVLQTLTTTLF
ncbi:hypothetical protein Hanom_Chr04g00316751 [Helianthus anomalus]